MLIETQFEMHVHDGEVASLRSQVQVEGRLITLLGLKKSEQSFFVCKYIFRSDEPSHGSVY